MQAENIKSTLLELCLDKNAGDYKGLVVSRPDDNTDMEYLRRLNDHGD